MKSSKKIFKPANCSGRVRGHHIGRPLPSFVSGFREGERDSAVAGVLYSSFGFLLAGTGGAPRTRALSEAMKENRE